MTVALSKQVGGSHYKDLPIQPAEFCMKNKLNYCQSIAIRYLLRAEHKNGIEDLDKAIHCIELYKEFINEDSTKD